MADQSDIWTPTEEIEAVGLGDLAGMDYEDLVDQLRKDLQLNLATDVQQNTFPVVTGLIQWISPLLLVNGWTQPGGGQQAAQYTKDPLGFVHMRGSLLSGTSSTPAFTLPAGFRPDAQDFYPALQSNGTSGAFIHVDTAGVVQPTYTVSGGQVWLNAVRFFAQT